MPDRYEILDKIGSGGQAVVYRARDQRLGREVAIKLPPSTEDFHDTEARHEFEREAKMLARLDAHPAVVHVYDFGIEENRPFVVMRYVEGENLKEHLEHRGPLSAEGTAQLGQHLASALSHAHEEGVLHRDLKPKNVLLEDGQLDKAMLVDFGIAYLLERTTTAPREGTPAYMSPEQLNADPLDERSDIYGLGALLYKCASGNPPYGRGEIYQVVTRIVKGDRERLREVSPEIPSWLAEVVETCLAEEPKERYESAKAVEESFQRGEDPTKTMSGPPTVEMPSAVNDHPEEGEKDDWLSLGGVAMAVLPVLALGILVVGLEWGGIIDWGERLSGGMSTPAPSVEEESTPASAPKKQSGSKTQGGNSEAANKSNDRATKEDAPSAQALKRRGDSLYQEGKKDTADQEASSLAKESVDTVGPARSSQQQSQPRQMPESGASQTLSSSEVSEGQVQKVARIAVTVETARRAQQKNLREDMKKKYDNPQQMDSTQKAKAKKEVQRLQMKMRKRVIQIMKKEAKKENMDPKMFRRIMGSAMQDSTLQQRLKNAMKAQMKKRTQ